MRWFDIIIFLILTNLVNYRREHTLPGGFDFEILVLIFSDSLGLLCEIRLRLRPIHNLR